MRSDTAKSCVICKALLPFESFNSRTCDHAACRSAYRKLLERRQVCEVCGTPLPVLRLAAGAKVCGDIDCRLKSQGMRNRPNADSRCSVCGVVLPNHRSQHETCDNRDCLALQHEAQRREQIAWDQQRQAQLEEKALSQRDRDARDQAVLESAAYLPVVVPHLPNPLKPRDEGRVRRLTKHLQTLVQNVESEGVELHASNDYERGDSLTPSEEKLFGVTCRLCRGVCCGRGGDRAFLGEKAIAGTWRKTLR